MAFAMSEGYADPDGPASRSTLRDGADQYLAPASINDCVAWPHWHTTPQLISFPRIAKYSPELSPLVMVTFV
jgi:hypothetical protein